MDPPAAAAAAGATATGEAAAAAAASTAAVSSSARALRSASVSARSFALRAAPVTDRVFAWTLLGDLASLNAEPRDPRDPRDPSELGAPPELSSSAACAGVNFPTPALFAVGGGTSPASAAAAIFLSAESPPGVQTGGRSWPVMGRAEAPRGLTKRCDAPSSLSGVWKMLASKPFLLAPSGVPP